MSGERIPAMRPMPLSLPRIFAIFLRHLAGYDKCAYRHRLLNCQQNEELSLNGLRGDQLMISSKPTSWTRTKIGQFIVLSFPLQRGGTPFNQGLAGTPSRVIDQHNLHPTLFGGEQSRSRITHEQLVYLAIDRDEPHRNIQTEYQRCGVVASR